MRSGGVEVGSDTAGPGQQVEVRITNGAATVEISVFGGPVSVTTLAVGPNGSVIVNVPPDAADGTFITVATGNPPASATIEVVTTGG